MALWTRALVRIVCTVFNLAHHQCWSPRSATCQALIVVVVAVMLSSCGGGDESSADESASTSAPSPSSSTESSKSDLTVAVIGDSIPYGGTDCYQCETFVDLYGTSLSQATGLSVEAVNLSTHDGLTTPALLKRIEDDVYYRDAVAAADILIVSTGHNDTPWAVLDDPCDGASGETPTWSKYVEPCMTQTAQTQARDLERFLEEAKSLRAGKRTVQIVTTVYNDWIGWEEAPEAATVPSVATLDAFFHAGCAAADKAGAVCLDNYHAFNGPQGQEPAGKLLGDDYVHPSQKGHDLFARLLMDVDVTSVVGR